MLEFNWELDYTPTPVAPYEDCTDGDFTSSKQFNKGDIISLVLEPGSIKRRVRVVISVPDEGEYKTYFDIL